MVYVFDVRGQGLDSRLEMEINLETCYVGVVGVLRRRCILGGRELGM